MTSHCPRCSNVMRAESDSYGRYLQCMICGYCNDIATVPAEIRASTEMPEVNDNGVRHRMRAPGRLLKLSY